MCVLSAALYVGTPQSSRGLAASDGGRWVPEDWGALTDARPSWGESGSLPSPLGPRRPEASPPDAASRTTPASGTLPDVPVPARPPCQPG